jgi:N-acetylneuraminic acid mutarotase
MRARSLFVLCALVLLAAVAAAQEEIPILTWTAPPYWVPPAPPKPAPEDAGLLPAEIGALDTEALPTGPLPFIAITPCRLIDTRNPVGTYGGPPLTAGVPRSFPVAGQCGVAADADAVSVNATVTNTQGPGFVALYPEGGTFPGVSNVNYAEAWQTVANAAVIPLGPGGFTALAGVSGTDLLVDVNGYYAPLSAVTSLTGGASTLTGDVTLAAGTSIAITPSGQTLTISGPTSLPPSGTAGGNLTGSYPDPTLAANSVGNSQLQSNSVTAGKIASAQVVKNINAVQDSVTLQGSGAVSVATVGSTITIGAPSGSMVLGPQGDTTLIGAGYTEIAQQVMTAWTPTASTGAPAARNSHTAVWTGSRMIVWGGLNTYPLGDGGLYDPVTDTWIATSATGAPSARYNHAAVWTGTEMVVWGGMQFFGVRADTGGRYDPVANTWTATTTTGAPTARYGHRAVWTGSRVVVWGGHDGAYVNTGGRYDPVGNAWSATTTADAPTARLAHTAVWTGTRMVVWGGLGTGTTYLATGGLYDPAGDTWTATATSGAPTGRYRHTGVWTGTLVVVWGGHDGANFLDTGGSYDPAGDNWAATATAGAPSARYLATSVWIGSRVVVWGGATTGSAYLNDGAQYDPVANAWTALTASGPPGARQLHTAVWTGASMVVWGGDDGATWLGDGGQWRPVSLYVKN